MKAPGLGESSRSILDRLKRWGSATTPQLAADLGLNRIDASLGRDLQPLVLRSVTGRLAGQLNEETFEFSTAAL